MNILKIVLIAMTLNLGVFTQAQASLVYNFDVSDLSWTDNYYTTGDFAATTYSFEFADTADLNALNLADLLSMSFSIPGYSATFTNTDFYSDLDINHFFGISGGIASLTVGYGNIEGRLDATNANGDYMLIGQGYWAYSLTHGANYKNAGSLFPENQRAWGYGLKTYTATVPEPSILTIFALGIIGISLTRLTNRA